MSLGSTVAEHLAGLRYEDIPPEVVHAAKRLILDTLGVAWAGAEQPGCREVRRHHTAIGGVAEAHIWSTGAQLPAASAAFVNGAFAAALDYDSLHTEGVVHPEIVTLPAAIALAERGRCSGRHLIIAVVAGGDLLCRLGRATPQPGHWFVSSTGGALAAAAAAGILLRFDAARMRDALGLALCQAGGTIQAALQQTLAKRLQTAFATRNGVEAAMLAGAGIDGPRDIFDGTGGYFPAFGGSEPGFLTADLGQRFETRGIGIKKFPSCACNHAAIEGTARLMRQHAIRAGDVRHASVRVSPFMMEMVGAPFDPSGAPQVTAQFSAAYSVASTLLRGAMRLDDLAPAAVQDPEVAALVERIDLVVDEGNDGKLAPVEVILETGAGRFSAIVDDLPGSATCPLGDDDLLRKFRDCIRHRAPALPAERIEEMAAMIFALDEVNDVRQLFRCWPVASA